MEPPMQEDNGSYVSFEIDYASLPISEGWLFKKGGRKGGRKNWKRRYFKFEQERLSYYTDETLNRIRGFVPLTDRAMVIDTGNNEMHKNKNVKYTFTVLEDRSVPLGLELSADSIATKEAWMESIQFVINKLIEEAEGIYDMDEFYEEGEEEDPDFLETEPPAMPSRIAGQKPPGPPRPANAAPPPGPPPPINAAPPPGPPPPINAAPPPGPPPTGKVPPGPPPKSGPPPPSQGPKPPGPPPPSMSKPPGPPPGIKQDVNGAGTGLTPISEEKEDATSAPPPPPPSKPTPKPPGPPPRALSSPPPPSSPVPPPPKVDAPGSESTSKDKTDGDTAVFSPSSMVSHKAAPTSITSQIDSLNGERKAQSAETKQEDLSSFVSHASRDLSLSASKDAPPISTPSATATAKQPTSTSMASNAAKSLFKPGAFGSAFPEKCIAYGQVCYVARDALTVFVAHFMWASSPPGSV